MPIPTATTLKKHPLAVVFLTRITGQWDTKGTEYDFEWFETDEGQEQFFADCVSHVDDDVKANGDLMYAVVEVKDTQIPPVLGRIHMAGSDPEQNSLWESEIKSDPTVIVKPSARRTSSGGGTKPKAAPKVKPKIKPKAKSAAAKVITKPEEKGGEAMKQAATKAQALKKRLDAKKAEAAAAGQPATMSGLLTTVARKRR